jgi:hypothetical protein
VNDRTKDQNVPGCGVKFTGFRFGQNTDDPVTTYYIEETGDWVVSHHQVWVEGAYETEFAAQKAPFVDPDALHELWMRVRPDRITEEQIHELWEEALT